VDVQLDRVQHDLPHRLPDLDRYALLAGEAAVGNVRSEAEFVSLGDDIVGQSE